MAKKEASIVTLIVALTAITICAAMALSGVYILTKEPIKQINIQKNSKAKLDVLTGFDDATGSYKEVKIKSDVTEDSLVVSLAFNADSTLFGAAVATHTKIAFSGRFDIMVGFNAKGEIINTEVLKHNETPGLGDKIDKKKHNFPLIFVGLNPATPLQVKKDGGTIDAITAATISSRAFCDAVNRAHTAFEEAKKTVPDNQNQLETNTETEVTNE